MNDALNKHFKKYIANGQVDIKNILLGFGMIKPMDTRDALEELKETLSHQLGVVEKLLDEEEELEQCDLTPFHLNFLFNYYATMYANDAELDLNVGLAGIAYYSLSHYFWTEDAAMKSADATHENIKYDERIVVQPVVLPNEVTTWLINITDLDSNPIDEGRIINKVDPMQAHEDFKHLLDDPDVTLGTDDGIDIPCGDDVGENADSDNEPEGQ